MSKKNNNLVSFFREAAPYIHLHRGKTFVIALSGEALEHANAPEVLSDIAILSSLGVRIVLVHGARPQIEKQLKKNNHEATVHKGLRITDSKTLEISKASIGTARLDIENHLNRALNKPPIVNSSLGIISGNFLTAKPLGVIDGVDYLHTGKVRKVNTDLLRSLLEQGNIALVSPLGFSPTGQVYNVLYEEVAGYVASSLKADKLIFLHHNKHLAELPRHCNLEQLDKDLKHEHSSLLHGISKTMHMGVDRTHLIDMESEGGLLLELYTRDGIGSMLSIKLYDEPRGAKTDDISGIITLIKPLEAQGTLAKRTRPQLELDIHSFSVIERDGLIIGCAALHPIDNTDTAELSCLAIHQDYRSGSRGVELVEYIGSRAKKEGLKKLFVLTTQSIDWFRERGFKERGLSDLPLARQKSYNKERNSKILFLELDS
jgi:amino-acid N-acetyltransferase